IAAAVLLPVPIEPVRPRTIKMAPESRRPPRAAPASLAPPRRTRLQIRHGPDAATCRDRRRRGFPADERRSADPFRAARIRYRRPEPWEATPDQEQEAVPQASRGSAY